MMIRRQHSDPISTRAILLTLALLLALLPLIWPSNGTQPVTSYSSQRHAQ